jgi:hypothetical protein
MKFALTIQTSNDAYVGDGAETEIADRLKEVGHSIRNGDTEGHILDRVNNSQKIGSWTYTAEAREES